MQDSVCGLAEAVDWGCFRLALMPAPESACPFPQMPSP